MKIRYEIVLDDSLEVDGDWPLRLPDGGLFRIRTEDGKAVAFEVEFTGEPSDHFRSEGKTIHLDDTRWTAMRPFFARLKSFIQLESEVNYNAVEVFANYDAESEDEQQGIPVEKVVITGGYNRKNRRPLDHEILGAGVLSSYEGNLEVPAFIAELKSLSRRSAREGRFVDSFRYSFLIVEALYGQGKFRSKQLADALSGSESLVHALEEARSNAMYRPEDFDDETSRLLHDGSALKDLIAHIVKMRGRYFHGTKALERTADWKIQEARAISELMALTTDRICREMVGEAYSDEVGDWYEDGCRRHGKVSKIKLDLEIRARQTGRLQTKTLEVELFGDFLSERTRIKWAAQSLEGLGVNDDEGEIESIRGIERRSKCELFSIRMVTTTSRMREVTDLNGNELRDADGYYEVVWSFEEEEEEGVTLKMAEAADETTFWFSGNSGKALVADMLRRGLEFNHLGLRKVVCRSKVKAQPVFEVLFDATDIGDAA